MNLTAFRYWMRKSPPRRPRKTCAPSCRSTSIVPSSLRFPNSAKS